MQLSGKKTDDGYKRKKLKRNCTSSSSEITPSEMEIDYIEGFITLFLKFKSSNSF